MRRLLQAALCAATAHGITIAPGWEQRLTNELHKIARNESQKYNCSVSIAFRSARGRAAAAFGAVDPTGAPATTSDVFVWGSVTKVVTGASILRLVADGKLALDDAAAPYVDRFLSKLGVTWTLGDLWGARNVSKTTVRDLLGMTSSVPDFDTANPCFPQPCKLTDPMRHLLYSTKQPYGPLDLLSLPWVNASWRPPCKAFSPMLEPFCYSSTGFMLLGMVLGLFQNATSITEVDQGAYLPPSIRSRSGFVSNGKPPASYTRVHGTDRTSYDAPPGQTNHEDVFEIPGVFAGWSASDFVGDAQAAADVAFAIYGSKRVTPNADLMIPGNGTKKKAIYGLATFDLASSTGQKGDWGVAYGHMGATYGYQSLIAYFPKLEAAIAVGTSLETDTQQHPSDTLCFAYNKAVDVVYGVAHACSFAAGSYYGGACACEPIPVVL